MAGQDPAYNRLGSHSQAFAAPALRHQAITVSDVTVYDGIRAIFVGVAGTLVLTDTVGASVTYTVPAGGVVQLAATKIGASSTATGIVAMF